MNNTSTRHEATPPETLNTEAGCPAAPCSASVDLFMRELGKCLCDVMNYAGVEATMGTVPKGFLIRFGGLSFGVTSEGTFDQPDFSTAVFKAGIDGVMVGSGVPDSLEGKIPPIPQYSSPRGGVHHGVVTRFETVEGNDGESSDGVSVAGKP